MGYKILIVSKTPPPVGGVTMHVFRLKEFLSAKGNDVKCIAPCLRNLIGIMHLLFSSDIVHLHSYKVFAILLPFIAIARLKGARVVFTVHSLRGKVSLVRWLCRFADKVLVGSNDVYSLLDVTENDLVKIYSPFMPICEDEKSLFEPFESEELTHKSQDEVVISFNAWTVVIENNIDIYGLDVFLEAIGDLVASGRKVRALICIPKLDQRGSTYVRSLIMKFHIPDECIDVVGRPVWFVQILRNSDLFVRANRSDGAGATLSICEALSLGVPVIASDCVKRPEGASLFETGNSRSLQICMQSIEIPKKTNTTFKELNYLGQYYLDYIGLS